MASYRKLPNIIITGTPGCGKTSHAELLCAQFPELTHINVSQYAKDHQLIESYDEERDSSIIDEDRLLDELEPRSQEGGLVIDWHCCEIFPERWIDLVVVIRCDNSVLYKRLEDRGYRENKISENIECEIMQVLLQEARENYDADIIVELQSDDIDVLNDNVDRIAQWVQSWQQNNPEGVSNELP